MEELIDVPYSYSCDNKAIFLLLWLCGKGRDPRPYLRKNGPVTIQVTRKLRLAVDCTCSKRKIKFYCLCYAYLCAERIIERGGTLKPGSPCFVARMEVSTETKSYIDGIGSQPRGFRFGIKKEDFYVLEHESLFPHTPFTC